MKVAIFGPNLSGVAQRMGNFHVHAEGCGDCKHYGYNRKFGGDNAPGKADMIIEATSKWDVADFIYGPDAGDFDGTVEENMSDFHFAPCVRLPDMTDANRAEEAARAAPVGEAAPMPVAPAPSPARTVTTVEDALEVLADANAEQASIDAALALLA